MKKRTLVILLALSLAFDAIYALTALNASSESLVALGTAFSLLGAVTGLIALIGGLIKQAKRRQWGWFVCTILFGVLCLVIYLIVVPDAPTYRVYQPKQDYQPQPHRESEYYYRSQPYQEVEQRESSQPYQEATRPEFYEEQWRSDSHEGRER